MRMRLILYKQDEISLLESELNAIDNAEDRPLFLGARRRDRNEGRKMKLQDLDAALIEYGKFVFHITVHVHELYFMEDPFSLV